MRLPEVKGQIIPNSTNFTVMVENCIGEHPVPRSLNVTVRQAWDGFDVQEIVKLEHPEKSSSEHDDIMQMIFSRWRDKERHGENHWACSEDFLDAEHCYSDFHEITFWARENGFEKLVQNYMESFKGYLMDLWVGRGADDDYFDYLPSITDIFYALCEFFEMQDEWEDFKCWLVAEEGEEVLEDSLYRN